MDLEYKVPPRNVAIEARLDRLYAAARAAYERNRFRVIEHGEEKGQAVAGR